MNIDAEAAVRAPAPSESFDYILLSDVHLGSDLVSHLRPWATSSWLKHEAEVDERLVSMLEHYRRAQPAARRLRVVVAGDFLELVGVSLPPTEVKTRPTREERIHGLGSAADHVVAKVRAIASRHPRVFRALAELLAAGHELVVVRGNHDIELHWHAAQHAFVAAILEHVEAARHDELRARIAMHPWFFAVPGLLYVEHGHHFDVMCSYGDPLLPTCPRDSRRIRQVPFSVLLRNVARPTRGLSTAAYEHVGFAAYLGLLSKLGVAGSVRIAVRFGRAAVRLLSEWVSHVRGERGSRRHGARVRRARFAARTGCAPEQLAALEALHARPAARSLLFVVRSLYLDRVLALLVAAASVVAGALLARYREFADGIACALPAVALATYAAFGGDRDLTPAMRMRASAAAIARLFDARWVVMGHTHQAAVSELDGGAQYVNLGHWGEDDLPEERDARAVRCPATYLRLWREQGGYRAELMRWDSRDGPSRAVLGCESSPTTSAAPVLTSCGEAN